MQTSIIIDENIKNIIVGLEKLNSLEQKSILAQINATLMLKKGLPKIS